MDELLIKYLLNETDPKELAEIQRWLEEKPENQRYFNQFKLIWEESKKLEKTSTLDENAAWERFKQRVEPQSAVPEPSQKVLPLRMIMRFAAALVITFGATWLAYSFWKTNYANPSVTLASSGEVITKVLADGSVVTLNKNSILKFTEKFTGDKRLVSLTGEAFFDITPDKEKPFYIESGDVTVKVVGTSFNVKNTKHKTEVTVETGQVEVAKKNHLIKLTPGERAIVPVNDTQPTKQKINDTFYNFYKTKTLVCDNTPLWKLVQLLNEQSALPIVITNEKLNNLPISTTFKNQSIDSILSIVSQTLGIQMEHKEDKILLK
jgi:transmembrane sensor